MTDFHFESDTAAIPIMASRWDSHIESARVFYQNTKCLKLYGDLKGQLLIDVFSEILRLSQFETVSHGSSLIQQLMAQGFIKNICGTLAGKRVELFSIIQQNTPNTIQSTIIDSTDRYLDTLSGIPGRELFYDRLNTELYRSLRENSELHICFIDLDGFKQTNDRFGHQVGDSVIIEVATRLQKIIRRHEMVSRFGGDEFVILLSGHGIDPVQFSENKLIPILNQPYENGTQPIDFIGASVGIASAPKHAKDSDQLINHADDAMYVAKANGKNTSVVFENDMQGMKKS